MQQLFVHCIVGEVHIPHNRATNEAIPYRELHKLHILLPLRSFVGMMAASSRMGKSPHHVRELVFVHDLDIIQLDVHVLIN